MKSIEVPSDGGTRTIELHPNLTVLRVRDDQRDAIASALATELGSAGVVRADDLPAVPRGGPATGDLVEAEASVAIAESAVADARAAVAHAERAYTSAQAALHDANRSIDRDAFDAVATAEALLEVAQAGAAAARRALVDAREAREQDEVAEKARAAVRREQIERLQAEKAELDERRTELVARLGALGEPPDPAPVEDALTGLRRLQQVRPRQSESAAALADRWVDVRRRLAELPSPAAPPEWLVGPALTALHEARAALARAETASTAAVDRGLIEAVEHAHRDVIDAERRVERKGNRMNRRRLDSAREAERGALAAMGVASYQEYVAHIAPGAEGAESGEDRIAHARAALADAEAVWDELHGGDVSPEYTAAKEEEAAIRTHAVALLGEEVDDAEVEARLRSHLETVVDTEWASQQLTEALAQYGIDVSPDDDDLAARAEAWLESVPQQIAARADLDREIGDIDIRLHDLDAQLSTHKAEAFFGHDRSEDIGSRHAEERGAGFSPEEPFADLVAALSEAEAAEAEAVDALREARRRLEESEAASTVVREREQQVDDARIAVDEAAQRLADAERALEAARTASVDAVTAAETARRDAERAANASGTSRRSLASDVWLLARLASARAASSETPVVVDARAVVAGGGLRLLERAAHTGQVIVLGDEDEVQRWVAGLGDRAAIRTI